MNAFFRLGAPLAAALALASLAVAADAAPARKRPAPPTRSAPQGPNWATAVELRDSGHVLGNPEAAHKLVEFASYTCSHCYEFSRKGDPIIRALLVPQGAISYEIRHLLRDPIDLTAALLTNCGAPEKFPGNHEAIMAKQPEWLATAQKATQAQRTRWNFGTNAARWRAIASDLGFYDIMEGQGYTRATLDHCLADDAKANALAEATQRDVTTYGLQGTPSFVLDGKLLSGVYNWESLQPVLAALD